LFVIAFISEDGDIGGPVTQLVGGIILLFIGISDFLKMKEGPSKVKAIYVCIASFLLLVPALLKLLL